MQNILARRIIYPLYQLKHGVTYGSRIIDIYRQLNKSEKYSFENLRKIQTTKFKKLVMYIYINVPYYREIMDRIGLLPEDIQDIQDIKYFPVLTKKEIKNNYSKIISKEIHKRKAIKGATGGTTGEPLIFYRDLNTRLRTEAILLRGMSWAKYQIGSVGVDFRSHGWPSFLGKIRGCMISCHYFPAFSNEKQLLTYFNRIKKMNVYYLTGYSSNIFRIASTLNKYNITDIEIPVIFSTAEMLYDYQRDFIEKQFSSRLFDYYGCNEIGAIAFECEMRRKHIADEHILIETIDGNNNSVHGVAGEITITDLDNFTMPFIRYKNGDVGQLSTTKCTCNRELTVLERIDGRTQEFLNTCDGEYLSSIFFTSTFRNMQGIENYQIVQTDINNIILKIVKNKLYSDTELNEMIRSIKKMIGEQVNVTVEVCSEIPLTGRGKKRLVISQLPLNIEMLSNKEIK